MRRHYIVTMELDVEDAAIGGDDMLLRLSDAVNRDSAFDVFGYPCCTDALFSENDSSARMARKSDDAMRLHGKNLVEFADLR